MSGATLLEYYVYIISPVEDENLSPDGSRGMSVSAHWHTRKRTRLTFPLRYFDQILCWFPKRTT